jgi:hypothetical protein
MRKGRLKTSRTAVIGAGFLYGVVGVGSFLYLSTTLVAQPLFPFKMHSLDWTKAWMIMAVVDYYQGALPLCGVVLASELNRIVAFAWITGILLVGSPFSCAWIVWRLAQHQTLRMHDAKTLLLADSAAD